MALILSPPSHFRCVVFTDRGQLQDMVHCLLPLAHKKHWHRSRGYYAGRLLSGLAWSALCGSRLRRINQTHYKLSNTAGENWEAHPKASQGNAQGRFRRPRQSVDLPACPPDQRAPFTFLFRSFICLRLSNLRWRPT
jgi:hypothetical protein